MATSVDGRTLRRSMGGPVLTIVAAIAALFSAGFLCGLPILLGAVVVKQARRSGDAVVQTWAWVALAVAVACAAVGYWIWQSLLWDMHYHPGGGGPIPPPTTLQLAAMPLIAGGIALVVFVLSALARRFLPRTTRTSS
jgi:hypothetical protein